MKPMIITFIVMFFAWPALAADTRMQSEIDYLIQSIQKSDCAFIRNGKAHSSTEAVEHILNKYDHFKDKIKTTEDFIDYCASKSLLSKKPYQIKCPDQDVIESRLWFLEELKQFRSQ